MIGRSGERGSGISVLAARYDDDDDFFGGFIIFARGYIKYDNKPKSNGNGRESKYSPYFYKLRLVIR